MIYAIPLAREGGPLFRQIYLWLRQAIAAGELQADERLPATRDLAEQLGVSRTVTVAAYDQLLAEGWIEGRKGSGTFVAPGIVSKGRPTIASAPEIRLKLSKFGMAAAAAAPAIDLTAPLRYDFSYRRSAVGEFPFEQWRRILMRKARMAPASAFDYGPSAGNAAL